MARPVSDVVRIETQVRYAMCGVVCILQCAFEQGAIGSRRPKLPAMLSPPRTTTPTTTNCWPPCPPACAAPPALPCRALPQSDWGYSLGSNNWQGPSGYINGKKIDPLMGSNWENKPNLEAAAAGVKKE
jgi:hypothetical protein